MYDILSNKNIISKASTGLVVDILGVPDLNSVWLAD